MSAVHYPLYYSQRMLNPFHGLVQVVETPMADAVSRDGRLWSLYVQFPKETLPNAQGEEASLPDVKYATWSAEDGLKRAPVRSSEDLPWVEAHGQRLLEAIKAGLNKLPFTQQDPLELWLVDQTQRPLALLESLHRFELMERAEERQDWLVSFRCRDQLKPSGKTQQLIKELRQPSVADAVAFLIQRAAGKPSTTQWFYRSSQPPTFLPASFSWLEPQAFPPLLIADCSQSPQEFQLLQEYQAWQAPWLLQLQSLTPELRQSLETQAMKRPQQLLECAPFIPQKIQQDAMTACLVAARMMQYS